MAVNIVMGPKNVWVQIILGGLKILGSKIFLGPEYFRPNNVFSQQNFWVKNFWVRNIWGQKEFVGGKNFRSKYFWGGKNRELFWIG